MYRSLSLGMGIVTLMSALCVMLVGCREDPGRPAKTTVKLYAGAGLRKGVEALAREFEAKTGIAVEPDYAGSAVVLVRAQMDPRADLFMPGDVWYVDRLAEKADLIESKTSIAYFVPVIIVDNNSERVIEGLSDLFAEGVKVGLGDPKACQIGRLSVKILTKNSLDPTKLDAKLAVTVNELAVWAKMGTVDAAIVWGAIANNVADSVRIVRIPIEKNIISHVVVGLMKTSANKQAAKQFVQFMISDRGRDILKSAGFQTEAP